MQIQSIKWEKEVKGAKRNAMVAITNSEKMAKVYNPNVIDIRQILTNELQKALGGSYKTGFGGSHVWVSDLNNERVLIIALN